MTALATAPIHRIATTARIHAANPWTILYTPWLILFGVFALNFAIWHAVLIGAGDRPLAPDAFTTNGGVTYIFVYMVVVAVQAMNQTFSFVVGLGATRRDYFGGTVLVFGALSVVFGVGISLLAWVERATDGWGVRGAFFAPGPLRTEPIWVLAVMYTLLLLLMFFVGSAVAATFVRWGANGIIIFFGALALLIVGVVYAITVNGGWEAVGRFFTTHSMLGLAAYTIPVTLVGGLAGFLLMSRATPKG